MLLVDYTGRLYRDGKAAFMRKVADVLDRPRTYARTWQARLEKLSKRVVWRFLAGIRQRLR
jgi:hypothetical protein